MDFIPGIIIAVIYFIYIQPRKKKQPNHRVGKFRYIKSFSYSLILGLILGLAGAVKIIYFPDAGHVFGMTYYSCIVLLALFGDEILKLCGIDVFN